MKFLSNPCRLALAALAFFSAAHSSVRASSSVTLVPQEQAIADYMASNSQQGRPQLILDPVIEGVARARAKDMAERNYFSHVNPDGVAANYLLRQAGYVLPAWWGGDPAANYVESIAAGYSQPSATWNAWMSDSGHKTHLLALNSFFATETHYGVGYYYDPNSTYQYYWVVITAPPQPAPPVAITAPANNATLNAPTANLAGTADTTTNPATVQYRVENVSGTSDFTVASGIANWSGTVTGLVPGMNVIRAETLDASGNLIAQTTSKVDYVVLGTLTVGVSGSGSVSSAYAGVTSEPVGNNLTIKATPASGYVFAGWTGAVTSGSATMTFTMQDGDSLQANFIPNPFPAVAGSYYGVLGGDASSGDGVVRIALTSSGAFTGRVQMSGEHLVFCRPS